MVIGEVEEDVLLSSEVFTLPRTVDVDVLTPEPVRAIVEPGGRVTVPAAVPEALRVSEGDSVVLSLEGDEVRVRGPDAATRMVQRLVARYVPVDVSLADELQ